MKNQDLNGGVEEEFPRPSHIHIFHVSTLHRIVSGCYNFIFDSTKMDYIRQQYGGQHFHFLVVK